MTYLNVREPAEGVFLGGGEAWALWKAHFFFFHRGCSWERVSPSQELLQGLSMGHPLRGLAWGFIAKGSWVGTARISYKQLCLQQLVSTASVNKVSCRWQGHQTSPQPTVYYTRKMGPAVEGTQKTQTTEPMNVPVLLCGITQNP